MRQASRLYVFTWLLAAPVFCQTFIPTGTISTDTTWTLPGSPYVLQASRLTIVPGVTLTIAPGVVVKLLRDFSTPFDLASITVQGALIANGTLAQKITFTSFRDDTVGGDTNNDGNVTLPNPGDWFGIYFTSGSSGSISNSTIRYGGNATPEILVASGNASVSITPELCTQPAFRAPASFG